MNYLLTFERFKVKKWRRRIKRNKKMNSRKPILEPMNPDEMICGRTYDQTEPDIPGNFTVNVWIIGKDEKQEPKPWIIISVPVANISTISHIWKPYQVFPVWSFNIYWTKRKFQDWNIRTLMFLNSMTYINQRYSKTSSNRQ